MRRGIGACDQFRLVGPSNRLVARLLCFLSFNNIFCLVELADKQHFHNYNIHNSRLVVVSELSCNFHIRRNIGTRLWALFLLSCVRSLDK